jgi:hypothetical protein
LSWGFTPQALCCRHASRASDGNDRMKNEK